MCVLHVESIQEDMINCWIGCQTKLEPKCSLTIRHNSSTAQPKNMILLQFKSRQGGQPWRREGSSGFHLAFIVVTSCRRIVVDYRRYRLSHFRRVELNC